MKTAVSRRSGAAIYSSLVLGLYDLWVLRLSNRWVWRCSTRDVLLPFFREHVGPRHLDVGVGTGYYLAHTNMYLCDEVALLDLNGNCLRHAGARARHAGVELMQADVLEPPATLQGRRFDSMSLFYLLHCLPGSFDNKQTAFAHLKRHLAPGGVLFGATILGDEARHNAAGRLLMRAYNRKGIFGNHGDTEEGLRAALRRHFRAICVQRHGRVALFSARFPRDCTTGGHLPAGPVST